MNRGVKSLVDNWDDWKKTLKSTNKDTLDWAKTAKECTKVVADLTGASEDLVLPAEFFDTSENLALIEKAAKGDAEAI
jgi:kynureninase